MTLLYYAFLHSVEFYVILLTVAALVVGLLARPSQKGPAETSFATGILGYDPDPTPRVEVSCLSDGTVAIRRCGLQGLTESATVALAITRIGFDLAVEERVTPGLSSGQEVNTATFLLPGLAMERYHVKYNSDPYSIFLSFALHNRPGMKFSRVFPA